MNRFRLLVILLFICLSLNSFAENVKISGRVLGYDGKPLPLANVTLESYWSGTSINQANPDGSFLLETEPNNIIKISFAGVNHVQHETQFVIDSTITDINIECRLSPLSLSDNDSDYGIIGSFNDFNFNDGVIPLKKNPNGTYSATVPNTGDTLFYQLIGVTVAGKKRSTNGTMQDLYVYDNGGDYRSAIVSNKKEIEIIFNPALYKFPESEAVVNSLTPDIQSQYDASEKIDVFNKVLRENWRNDKDNRIKYVKDFLFSIEEMIDREKSPFMEKYLLVYYIGSCSWALWSKDISMVNLDKLSRAMRIIPYNSALWKQGYNVVQTLFAVGFETKITPYIDSLAMYTSYPVDYEKTRNSLLAISLCKSYAEKEYINKVISESDDKEHLIHKAMESGFQWFGDSVGRYFYNRLQKDYPDSWAAENAFKKYKENKYVQVGKQCPEFSYKALDKPGVVYDNQTFKGKYVLIDLWATWCGPCVGEMGHIHEAYNQFKDKGFTVLSISFDKDTSAIHIFRNGKWKMPWNHVFAENAFKSSAAETFEVTGIPKPILVGPDGVVLADESELRGDGLLKTLAKYIK